MNHLYIGICEDDDADYNALILLITKFMPTAHITRYTSGEDFLASYKTNLYDLIILDIYMGDLTGIEVATKLRAFDKSVLIAFLLQATNIL
ncbi:MAG: response regulator [Lachnospiraceae bacterium]